MIELTISTYFEVSTPYEIIDEGETVDGIVISVSPQFFSKHYDGENSSGFTTSIFKHTDFLEEVGLLYEDLLSYEGEINTVSVWITYVTINTPTSIKIDYQEDKSLYEESEMVLSNGLFEPINQ